ncbi:MAG TPA: hypothetical protein VGJ10_11775, partial [Paraburkholderia sp.]
GRASIVKRHMIVIAMLPATFSRSDVTASQEESPPFPRKRQSVTTEGGEDVKTTPLRFIVCESVAR